MAFCSACGAQVAGAFCGKCGAPAGAPSQAAAPPPQPQPQQPPQPQPGYQAAPQAQPVQAQPYQGQPMGAAPARRKTSPIVWILGIVGAVLLLGVLSVVLVISLVVHKAKQAGFDSELMRNNPGLAISKMAAMSNPDIQVLSTNDRNGTITFRDKKTGKVSTLAFDDVKNGHFGISAQGDDGKTTRLDFGGSAAAKLPSWVPSYPGASAAKGGFSAVTSGGTDGEAGTVAFTTPDPSEKVQSYYEGKGHEMNMRVESTVAQGFGTVVKLNDPVTHHVIAVTIVGANPTTINLTYASK